MSDEGSSASSNSPGVLRNTVLLLGAQLFAAPVSILINAVAARRLGVAHYGIYYQALTFSSFAFLFVEWGQPSLLTRQVAMQRERGGELLGSGLAFRVGAGLLAVLLVPVLALAVGYRNPFVGALALALTVSLFATISGACQNVFYGYERTDVAAGSIIGWQILAMAVVLPVLLAGGGLYGLLAAQSVCAAIGAATLLWLAPRLRVPRLAVHRKTIGELLRLGRPFMIFTLVQSLQPMMDAAMLSWFGSSTEMGWYGAARKLTGVLVMPASALLLALYPTLCRLHAESTEGFRRTAADALHVVAVVALPLALGTLLFPELGVMIFGTSAYGPAAANLRVLAAWLLLVYFSMPIGSSLTACGRQSAWTVVLLVGTLTSAALDPFLITWFSRHSANGGLGVCVAALIGEIVTLSGAIRLLPAGVLKSVSTRRILGTLPAGATMVLVALATAPLPLVVRAVLAVSAYVLCLPLTGGVSLPQLLAFAASLRR